MKRYRKKPVVIEAVQYDGTNGHKIEIWANGVMVTEDNEADARIVEQDYEGNRWLSIGTLEGEMLAHPGDWVIKGVKGEFYPCKPDIFEETYEEEAG